MTGGWGEGRTGYAGGAVDVIVFSLKVVGKIGLIHEGGGGL